MIKFLFYYFQSFVKVSMLLDIYEVICNFRRVNLAVETIKLENFLISQKAKNLSEYSFYAGNFKRNLGCKLDKCFHKLKISCKH